MRKIKNKLIYLYIMLFIMSCDINSNKDLIREVELFMRKNQHFLLQIIDEIEAIPNLSLKEHKFITFSSSQGNTIWHLKYCITSNEYDTLKISKESINRWNNNSIVLSIEYDIINQITYFNIPIYNRNGRSVVLLHTKKTLMYCDTLVEKSGNIENLNNFKYSLTDNWIMISPNNWQTTTNLRGYEQFSDCVKVDSVHIQFPNSCY